MNKCPHQKYPMCLECYDIEPHEALRQKVQKLELQLSEERERCAKIADDFGAKAGNDAAGGMAHIIAQEIRAGITEKRNDAAPKDPRNGCIDFGHKGPIVGGQEGLDWVSRCRNCGEQIY